MAIEITIVFILILIGIALIMVEIFLIPGITVAGIGGGIILIGSIAFAFHYLGESAGYITILATAIIGIGAFVFLIKSKTLDHFALKTDIESKIDQSQKLEIKVGDSGITLSRINPMGKAEFHSDIVVEVKSFTGEFIDSQVCIEVVRTENSTIFIQPIDNI